MSKLSLALKLADETGVAVQKALRYVDDVGGDLASKSLDDVTEAGSRTVSKWFKPAAAGTVLAGGGVLAWNQQTVEKAQAKADTTQSAQAALADIIDSDLPPDLKREMVRALIGSTDPADDQKDEKNDGGGLIPDDPQTLIILVIVMALVLKFALDGGD